MEKFDLQKIADYLNWFRGVESGFATRTVSRKKFPRIDILETTGAGTTGTIKPFIFIFSKRSPRKGSCAIFFSDPGKVILEKLKYPNSKPPKETKRVLVFNKNETCYLTFYGDIFDNFSVNVTTFDSQKEKTVEK